MSDVSSGLLRSVTFVRHGQTGWNAAQGTADQEQLLTPDGELQMQNVAAMLRSHSDYDYIVSSPLTRAVKSLKILKTELSLQMPSHTNDLLVEREYGQKHHDSKDVTPGNGYDPFYYPAFRLLPNSQKSYFKPYDGFESDNDIIQRYNQFSQELAVLQAKHTLAITHGGFIRTVLMHHGFTDYEHWNTDQVQNAGAYKIEYYTDGSVIITQLTS